MSAVFIFMVCWLLQDIHAYIKRRCSFCDLRCLFANEKADDKPGKLDKPDTPDKPDKLGKHD